MLQWTGTAERVMRTATKRADRSRYYAGTIDSLDWLVACRLHRASAAYRILKQAGLLSVALPERTDEGTGHSSGVAASFAEVLSDASRLAEDGPRIGTQDILAALLYHPETAAGKWLLDNGLQPGQINGTGNQDDQLSPARSGGGCFLGVVYIISTAAIVRDRVSFAGLEQLLFGLVLVVAPVVIFNHFLMIGQVSSNFSERCTQCKVQPEFPAWLDTHTGLCPSCVRKQENSYRTNSAPLFLSPLLLAAMARLWAPSLVVFFINCQLSLILYPLSILAHELGHMAAAKLIGMSVPYLEVGSGQNVFARRWGATFFLIHLPLTMGLTMIADYKSSRGRSFVTILGGPLATLCLCLLGHTLSTPQQLNALAYIQSQEVHWAPTLYLWNAFFLWSSLFPRSYKFAADGVVRSDGAILLKLANPRHSEHQNTPGFPYYDVARNYAKIHQVGTDLAIEILRHSLASTTATVEERLLLAQLLVCKQDFSGAFQEAHSIQFLITPGCSPLKRASLLSQLATIYVKVGEFELAESALQQAQTDHPACSAANLASGLLQIARGRLNEAEDTLTGLGKRTRSREILQSVLEARADIAAEKQEESLYLELRHLIEELDADTDFPLSCSARSKILMGLPQFRRLLNKGREDSLGEAR